MGRLCKLLADSELTGIQTRDPSAARLITMPLCSPFFYQGKDSTWKSQEVLR